MLVIVWLLSSPVYIDDSVTDMETVCKRIVYGKHLNAGQVCVGPDYLLCSSRVQQSFVEYYRKVLKQFYGEDPKKSTDFGRIVNNNNFMRITKLIETSGKVVIGGDSDPDQGYIAPTLLVDVSSDDPVYWLINFKYSAKDYSLMMRSKIQIKQLGHLTSWYI